MRRIAAEVGYSETAFAAPLGDARPFEQWSEEGAADMQQRAHAQVRRMLADYELPPMDEGIDEALLDFIACRKVSCPDQWY